MDKVSTQYKKNRNIWNQDSKGHGGQKKWGKIFNNNKHNNDDDVDDDNNNNNNITYVFLHSQSDSEKSGSGNLFDIILNGKDNNAFPTHPKIPKQAPYTLQKKKTLKDL